MPLPFPAGAVGGAADFAGGEDVTGGPLKVESGVSGDAAGATGTATAPLIAAGPAGIGCIGTVPAAGAGVTTVATGMVGTVTVGSTGAASVGAGVGAIVGTATASILSAAGTGRGLISADT